MELGRSKLTDAPPFAPGATNAAGSAGAFRTALEACGEIDELLEELTRLAASDSPSEQVHEQLLLSTIRAADAIGGAIWIGRDHRVERLPRADEGLSLCIAAPFDVEPGLAGAVELLVRVGAPKAEQERALQLATAVAEVAGDFQRRERLNEYRKREKCTRAALQFIERIHRAELHETAVAIVNEGRWFIGCDRVSLLCTEGRGCKLLAVSGVDRLEPRARINRAMRGVAATVLATHEPLWELGDSAARAPQIEQPLQEYLEESHARALVALPLQGPPVNTGTAIETKEGAARPSGVLVMEWFAVPQLDATARERIDLAAHHAANALSVALITGRLPLIRVSRSLAKVGWLIQARQLPTALWVLGIIAALVAALVMVPADFEVTAEGELRPVERREIFAPADGVVDAVLVEHGSDVTAGQTLLRLRSPAIDFEEARLHGEIQTVQKRLAGIRAARFERGADNDNAIRRHSQLTAEEEELKQTLHSLHEQEQLLAAQRTELEVRAPLAGRVLTWDVARSLAARPIERGQSLLSVGDVAGRWQIELAVPDDKIGYVLAAQQECGGDRALPVSFLLITNSGVTYEGEVERIALRSHIDENRGEAVVLVTVRFDQPIEDPRPGASVVGKIQCGRRSLGFVWLHDAWNSIKRRVLF